jgi:tetratricopeptide (TPR) repeat protein
MIVRNAAETISRALASAAPHVTEINVLDTGSDDGTVELVEREATALAGSVAVRLVRGSWRDDFAAARNESFELASPDADWLLWLDADDELVVAGRLGQLVDSSPPSTTALAVYYECAHDTLGRVVEGVWRVRLVRPTAGYRWQGAVHEALVLPPGTEGRVDVVAPERARVVHRPPPGHSGSDRNLALLLRSQAEAERSGIPLDPRSLLSLGLELAGRARFAEAAEALGAYAGDDRQGWTDERAHAVAQRSACLRALGRLDEAIEIETEAAAARPDWVELPLGLSDSYARAGRWSEAERYAVEATAMPLPATAVRLDPRWLRLGPLLRLAEAQLGLGGAESARTTLGELRSRAEADLSLAVALDSVDEAIANGGTGEAHRRVRELAGRYDPSTRAVAQGLRLDARRAGLPS